MVTLIPLVLFLSSGLGILSTCPLTSSLPTMALTLEDFIRISDKNRAEDLNKINVMIESGVRAEVERVVKPMQTQNEERFGILESEMSKLKDLFKASPPLPQPAQVHSQQDHPGHRQGVPLQGGGVTTPAIFDSDKDRVKDALRRAKNIISLEPIHKRRDVERQYRQYDHITSDDLAMKSAVIEYIDSELKCHNIPNIVSVFPPANTPEYDRIEDKAAASHVSSFARVIRKPDHQVSIYVPRSFQSRFRAFNDHARSLRTAPGLSPGDVKTKVKYGLNDFVLLSKPRNGRWTAQYVNTENFPPLQPPPGPAQSSDSPPPGRPRGSPPAAPPGRQRGSPSPPPNLANNPNKRGASSPLESGAKATKSTEVPALSEASKENTPPKSPLYSPSLATHTPPPDQPSFANCFPKNYCNPLPDLAKSVLPSPDQDNGQFAQTAACSPSVSTNKHFTFDTRRQSLPASVVQGRSLN